MENRERTSHILHQPEGDIAVKIVEQTPDSTKAEVKFLTPEVASPVGFKAVLDLVDAEAPKPKGKLMRLADAIRNLERPEMRKGAKRNIKRRIERARKKKFG